MSVLIPMEGVNMTVLIQLVATTAHALIPLDIHLMKMVTIVLVSNSTTTELYVHTCSCI